jgi:hypothetical protein
LKDKTDMASNRETAMEFDRKVQSLSDKVDRILEVLMQTEPRPGVRPATAPAAKAEAGKEPSPKVRDAPSTAGEPATDKPVVEDLGPQVQTVSEKVERILETLTRMQAVLPLHQENPPVEKITAKGKHVARPPAGSQSASQSDIKPVKEPRADQGALKDLCQRVQGLSEKMDRVMKTMTKVEGLLPEQGKAPRIATR